MSKQTMQFVPAEHFRERTRAAVSDAHLQKSFRGAMDFLMAKRAAQFPQPADFERLRDTGEAIRRYSLARLPELLERLEEKLTANGFPPGRSAELGLFILSVIEGATLLGRTYHTGDPLRQAGAELENLLNSIQSD